MRFCNVNELRPNAEISDRVRYLMKKKAMEERKTAKNRAFASSEMGSPRAA